MLIVFVGIPGSGKSTEAKRVARELPGVVVSNRDSLREQLFGRDYARHAPVPAKEKQVSRVQLRQVRMALSRGRDVIVDDTNLTPRVRHAWRRLANEFGVPVEMRYFDVDLQTALSRNAARDRRVPADVIRAMHAKATDTRGLLLRD